MSNGTMSYRDAMTVLRRTGTFDWERVGLESVPSSLDECLAWQPAEMERAASGFEAASRRVGAGLPADAGSDPGPLGYAPWVAAADGALAGCRKVQERSGEAPGALRDLERRDAVLRTIAHYGGRANDAAMNVRVCLGAFGWWVIRDVVAGLREQVAGMGRAEAERFLAPFSPMLVLLGQIMEDRDEGRDRTAAAVEKLTVEVQEATEERDQAETRLRQRGEPKLPRETLVEMAKRDDLPPPPVGRRRPRR